MSDAAHLVGELLSDDEERAEGAVLALGRRGASALDIVLPLCDFAEAETRWWALRAAAEIFDPRASAALAAALEDPDLAVRQAAALGLRLQPNPGAAADLFAALEDPSTLVQHWAERGLEDLGVGMVFFPSS